MAVTLDETVWIGLYLATGTGPNGNQTGVWSDESSFNSMNSFSNWAKGEPTQQCVQATRGQCVILWKKESFNWDNTGCSEIIKFRIVEESFIINTLQMESNRSNMYEVSNTLNGILNNDVELFKNQFELSRRILTAFDDFVEKYDVEKDGDFYSCEDNLQISIKKTSIEHEIIFGDNSGNVSTNSKIEIRLSPEIIQEAHERNYRQNFENKTQVGSILYKTSLLFKTDDVKYNQKVVDTSNMTYGVQVKKQPIFGENLKLQFAPRLLTNVISAAFSNVTMSSLRSPVCISVENLDTNVTLPEFEDMKPQQTVRCAFWDFNIQDWSSENCTFQYDSTGNACNDGSKLSSGTKSGYCQCNHLTHFAVLLDVGYIYAPKYMDDLTFAGSIASALFHLATIITVLCFRQMREDLSRLIIMNICINLFAVNVMFAVGIDRKEDNDFLCIFTSITLHFFTLSAWAWMFLEAVYLFRSLFLSRLLGAVGKKFIMIGGILAYGFPMIIAGMTYGFAGSIYLSEKYCWLSIDIITFTLVIPILAICGINVLVFCMSTYAITCSFKVKTVNEKAMLLQATRRILYMVFLLGIPWGFGLVMLLCQDKQAKEILSIIFIIFNFLQGLVIFAIVCVSDETIRKQVLLMCGRCCTKINKQEYEVNTYMTRTVTASMIDTHQPGRQPFRSGWV